MLRFSACPLLVRLTLPCCKKKIGLVGKGITFDSGGLSLKPPASMETMKMADSQRDTSSSTSATTVDRIGRFRVLVTGR